MRVKITNKPIAKPQSGMTFLIVQADSNGGTPDVRRATSEDIAALLGSGGGASITIDDSLSDESTNPVQNRVIAAALQEMQGAIDDLNYMAIEIQSISASPSQAEMGSTVTAVALAWRLNKKAAAATLDNGQVTLDGVSGTINLSGLALLANKTWTFTVTDERGASASRTASLTFLNRAYWGVAAEPAETNSAFVLGLTSSALASSRARTISVNAGANQFIWYAIPSRFGTPGFKVGGFDGGFHKAATFQHVNASGYTESYDIYRSDNAALGSTSVIVS